MVVKTCLTMNANAARPTMTNMLLRKLKVQLWACANCWPPLVLALAAWRPFLLLSSAWAFRLASSSSAARFFFSSDSIISSTSSGKHSRNTLSFRLNSLDSWARRRFYFSSKVQVFWFAFEKMMEFRAFSTSVKPR